MGIFTKKERMNWKTGKFEDVDGTKELTREEQFEPIHPRRQKLERRREIFQEEYDKAADTATRVRARRLAKARHESTLGERTAKTLGIDPFGSTFDRGVSPMQTHPRKKKKKKRKKTYQRIQRREFKMKEFDPIDNWDFIP